MADQAADQAAKQRTEDQKKHAETAKAKLAEDNKKREAAAKDAGVGDGSVKPTPTQEENDLAAMGVHVIDKEADGSPEEAPTIDQQQKHRQSESRPSSGGYANRQSTTKPAAS